MTDDNIHARQDNCLDNLRCQSPQVSRKGGQSPGVFDRRIGECSSAVPRTIRGSEHGKDNVWTSGILRSEPWLCRGTDTRLSDCPLGRRSIAFADWGRWL